MRRREIRWGDTRRHGVWRLPRLARVLHRRHRCLPPWPRRTDTHRSRWALLQCDSCSGDHRPVVGLNYDALLLVVATQILQMLRQLAPMVRFDGYHVLADITGVPDLYSPDQADAARPLAVAMGQSARASTQAVGPDRGHRVGDGRGSAAARSRVHDDPHACRACWAPPGRAPASRRVCSGEPGPAPTSSRCWPARIAVLAVVFPILATAVILVRLGRQHRAPGCGQEPGASRYGAGSQGSWRWPWWPGSPTRGGRAPDATDRSSRMREGR